MFRRSETAQSARENLANARANLADYSRKITSTDGDDAFAYLNGEVIRAETAVKDARRPAR